MTDTFKNFIYEFTFPHECEYAHGHYGDINFVVTENVPDDDGGATKFGIDEASHPHVNIDGLTPESAADIYWQEFNEVKFLDGTSALIQLPPRTAYAFFDSREVCGLTGTWKMLQRHFNLNSDGEPGNLTKQSCLTGGDFYKELIQERRDYHRLIVHNRPSQGKFLAGWLNRCDDLENYLTKTL